MEWTLFAVLLFGLAIGGGMVFIVSNRRRHTQVLSNPWHGGMDERRVGNIASIKNVEHVIDSANIGMYFLDIKSGNLSWSKHHYQIFGWPSSEKITSSMFRERVHHDDLQSLDDTTASALKEKTDFCTHYRLKMPDGSLKYVRGSGRFVFDSSGEAIGMNGAVIDVTAMTEAQNSVRERRAELNALAENSPDIIAWLDKEGRFLSISSKIENITGEPASFYIGKTHSDLGGDPVISMRWQAVIEGVVRYKTTREFDFNYSDRNGEEHFFITRAIPTFDEKRDVSAVLAIISDHTEREKAVNMTRAAAEVLKKADIRKNEYLATLAHELRGPLAPIASATQLIKMSSQRAVRERAREVIERQIANMSQLVNDLMEVGRISSGKIEIILGRIAIQQIIEQAVESTRPLLDAKQQSITLNLSKQHIWLDGDLLRLTQVFINLITNASKYSSSGTDISVYIRLNGSHIVVDVSDNGVGLTSEAMLEIFDLFVQVHATGSKAQGGLGIGLSLVKKLVEIHEGTVTVTSDGPNKGSCFTVTLPRADAPASVEPATYTEAIASKPMNVLVVDDNVDGATTLASLLEILGHHTVTAFNGNDALKFTTDQNFDIAFIDLGLPDISGIQVALRLRGTPKGRKLPLIALTGLGRDEDRYMTRAAGFEEHIVKPLKMNELNRIINTVARRQQMEKSD